jgi:hypothetical protein
MLKATSSYKMSKPLKTSLALSHFSSNEQRSAWKRAMIGAELAAEHARRTAGKRTKDTSE